MILNPFESCLIITVDGGPKIIVFVVNGVLCDGGDERQFGWGRFSPTLRAPNGVDTARLSRAVQSLRLYTRALSTSEAVGNFRAGMASSPLSGLPASSSEAIPVTWREGG